MMNSIKKFFLSVIAFFTSSSNPVEPVKPTTPAPVPPVKPPTPASPPPLASYLPLSWEITTESHPERSAWTQFMCGMIDGDLSYWLKASDIKKLCPSIMNLTRQQQIKVIGEFLVGVIYHESAYDPTCSGVDVGNVSDRGSFSDGLFQVSEDDQENYGWVKRFTWRDLLKAIPNITLGMMIWKRQLVRTSTIMLANSHPDRYWATVLIGNKNSEIDDILRRVKKNTGWCN